MMYELEALQTDLFIRWRDQSLPDGWRGMDLDDPVEPHKTRVTLRIDSDMLAWFRKLGPGYQKRLNRVLRVYWLSLLSGHIKGYPSDKVLPRLEHEARMLQEEMRERSRAMGLEG
ncbi:BrnA antitoxin family protein [Tateyamaria sp. SN6-1]|uniref:BrnA antitoxin family protein n=1 Tax=Tateyamaria sp. SN6-1 TaxID=3092148 RepID=UPI0039F54715